MRAIYDTSNGKIVAFIYEYQNFELMRNNWPGITTGIIDLEFDVNVRDVSIWKLQVDLETLKIKNS